MKNTIYLIGFMGAGKTYIGKKLSQKYNIPFMDLDDTIETKTGLSIQEIFAKFGEDHFRKIESEILSETQFEGVVSCGGGVLESKINREFLKDKNVVWIKCNWNTILERIKKSYRPLVKMLSSEQLKQLFHKRLELYAQLAKLTIDLETTKNPVDKIYEYFCRNE